MEKYFKHIKRPELIGDKENKICFLFNAIKLRFGDETTVEELFKNVGNPRVIVYDVTSLIGG